MDRTVWRLRCDRYDGTNRIKTAHVYDFPEELKEMAAWICVRLNCISPDLIFNFDWVELNGGEDGGV